MKLLLENWKKYLEEDTQDIMYHSTSPDSVEEVLANGLEAGGGRSVYTDIHADWADDIYGTRPVFLSVEKGKYKGVPLEVDVSGLPLVADLASVADLGDTQPRMDFEMGDGYVLVWDDGVGREELSSISSDGAVVIGPMLKPRSEAAMVAIKATGTAAVLEEIPPERIKQ